MVTRLIVVGLLPELLLAFLGKELDDSTSIWLCLAIIYGFLAILGLVRGALDLGWFLLQRKKLASGVKENLTKLEFQCVQYDFFTGNIEEFYEGVAFAQDLPSDYKDLKQRMFAVGFLNTISWLKAEGKVLTVWKLKKVHKDAIRNLRSDSIVGYSPV